MPELKFFVNVLLLSYLSYLFHSFFFIFEVLVFSLLFHVAVPDSLLMSSVLPTLQCQLVEYYYFWKKTPSALTSRPHRRHRRTTNLRKQTRTPQLSSGEYREHDHVMTACVIPLVSLL